MNKKQLKEKIKELPVDLSIAGFALLLGLAERGAVLFSEIFEGPSRGMMKSYRRISKMKNFWDYYDELKNLKQNSARTILWRLQKKGLIERSKNSYKLTRLGLKTIRTFQERQSEKLWDGKWRLIMFDIPEKKREDRNWLRWQLVSLDYKPLQKSIFIGKQPMEEDFYEEMLIRKLNQCVRLMTIGEIDDEEFLEF